MNLQDRRYVPLQWAESFEHMQALSADRLNETEGKVHLVGFSMGGFVASSQALATPERIASLTLIGYYPGGLSEQEMATRDQTLKAINSGRYSGMNKVRLGHFVHPSQMDNDAVTDLVMSMNEDLGAAVLKAHIESTTPRKDLRAELAKATFPIHLIAADGDNIAPLKSMKTFHTSASTSSLTIIEQAGHMMLLEQPQTLAKAIEQPLS